MSDYPFTPEAYESISDEDYPPIKHTAESFHMDAGDIILADDVATNDWLRKRIRATLGWMERLDNMPTGSLETELEASQILQAYLNDIGRLIIVNVVKNGYTKAKLGVDDE